MSLAALAGQKNCFFFHQKHKVFDQFFQGGHKSGKHRKLREFEKLSKSQGNLIEKPGKLRENVEYAGGGTSVCGHTGTCRLSMSTF